MLRGYPNRGTLRHTYPEQEGTVWSCSKVIARGVHPLAALCYLRAAIWFDLCEMDLFDTTFGTPLLDETVPGGFWNAGFQDECLDEASSPLPASTSSNCTELNDAVCPTGSLDLIAGLRALAERVAGEQRGFTSKKPDPADLPKIIIGTGKRTIADLDSDDGSSGSGERPRRVRRSGLNEELRKQREEER